MSNEKKAPLARELFLRPLLAVLLLVLVGLVGGMMVLGVLLTFPLLGLIGAVLVLVAPRRKLVVKFTAPRKT